MTRNESVTPKYASNLHYTNTKVKTYYGKYNTFCLHIETIFQSKQKKTLAAHVIILLSFHA